MAGTWMHEPKGRVRIGRPAVASGRRYAHHADSPRQNPPGHAERIAAHVARVEREMAARAARRARLRPAVAPEEFDRVPLTGRLTRRGMLLLRQRLALVLWEHGHRTRRDAASDLGITGTRLEGVIAHPWFHRAGRNRLALTPAGRAEAGRLAREGGPHAGR